MLKSYRVLKEYVPNNKRLNRNTKKSWEYGYNEEFDLIVISKDGTVGEVYYIQGIYVGLPEVPKSDKVDSKHNKWVPNEVPQELLRLKTTFDWEKRDKAFQARWFPYIDKEYDRRRDG